MSWRASCIHNSNILNRLSSGSSPKMLVRLVLVSVASAATALCASLKPVSDFGPNPTKIVMNIVVPAKLATKPAVIVAVS